MSVQVQRSFARWTEFIPEGEIRRLLKFQVKYYFGGGLPGALATGHLAQIVENLGKDFLLDLAEGDGAKALQAFNYSKTAGLDSLRLLLLKLLVKRQNLPYEPEKDYHQLLITAGAQQSIYSLLDATVNPGDFILSAGPSYLGFVSPVEKMGGKVVLCPSDQHGLTVEGVETAIHVVKRQHGVVPKLLYIISDSDNPKGTTLPWSRRQAFFEIAEREDILIVEDAAYKEIQFGGGRIDPIKSLDKDNYRVAYLSSTSKEVGVLRLGYAMVPEDLRVEMEKARGFYDLCSPVLTQMIAEQYYRMDLDSILKDVLATYARRCNTMVESIQRHFPEGQMTYPLGGFFVWWEAPQGVNFNAKAFNEAIAIPNDILYVPSEAFYPVEGWAVDKDQKALELVRPKINGMRLSFSAVSSKNISVGIDKLGQLLDYHLR